MLWIFQRTRARLKTFVKPPPAHAECQIVTDGQNLQAFHTTGRRFYSIKIAQISSPQKLSLVLWKDGTDLGADEQVGDAGGVLLQLWHPFLPYVLETGGIDHGEAYEEDVGHRVGQRPEAVVVLLQGDKPGRVREAGDNRRTRADISGSCCQDS